MFITVYLLLICVTLSIYNAIKVYKFRKILSKIPTPYDGLALFGNVWKIISNPDDIFDLVRKFSRENYPIYRLSSIFGVVVALLDPNDVEQVLSSKKHLQKSKLYSFLHDWLGTGLLTSSGRKWHARRKILTPAFHFSILQKYIGVFNGEADKLVRLFEEEGETINLIPLISQFTISTIAETAMGLDTIANDLQKQYKEAIYKLGNIYLERLITLRFLIKTIYKFSNLAKREREQIELLHNFSNGIIAEKQGLRNFSKKRFLDILLKAKEEGADIDDEGIREEVDTFMFEGHDTTAMALSFILFTLANHKNVQLKLYDEITEKIPGSNPTYADLQQLKYMERCIKEGLRLYPSVPFITRIAGETFTTTTGYTIPQGTILHLHIFDIHRNPKVFPNPHQFDPDRFLHENTENRHPFAYIPFSAGPRNCIGQKFALLEMKAALCAILRQFILEPLEDNVKFRPDMVLRPKTDIKIRILTR